MKAPDGMERATGRARTDWFALLDGWGAGGRPYKEIADWLMGEHGLSKWWAQKLIVEYEESRGLRAPGARRDGTFEVSASKTIAVPVEHVAAALVNAKLRKRWLPEANMRRRPSRAKHAMHFDWQDDGSRIVISLVAEDKARCRLVLQHLRLTNAEVAQAMKTHWRERLTVLKTLLETDISHRKEIGK